MTVTAPSPSPTNSGPVIVGLGESCGGFTLVRTQCVEGLVCIYNPKSNTDFPGVCKYPAEATMGAKTEFTTTKPIAIPSYTSSVSSEGQIKGFGLSIFVPLFVVLL
jgi:hypothetical protein